MTSAESNPQFHALTPRKKAVEAPPPPVDKAETLKDLKMLSNVIGESEKTWDELKKAVEDNDPDSQ